MAAPLFADPEVLVQSPPDFWINQALRGESFEASAQLSTNGLRWSSATPTAQTMGLQPDSILQLDAEVKHVLLADLSEHKVYLLENGSRLRVLRQMYGSIGKNGSGKQLQDDGRTPLGIYTVTRTISDSNLPELYGSGAFPVDYPNAWDRWHQRTGYGIWLHGVPREKFSRAPLSSEGCVSVANEDLDSLKSFVVPGNTRVVFSDKVNWLETSALASQRQAFFKRLEAWKMAWAELDTEQYLSFYAGNFVTPNMSREQFVSHKRTVNASKRYIEVKLDNLNMFNYPDGNNIRLVEFVQHYRSNNHNSVDHKQQFWQQADDGQWYILREATI
ncbi:MAG: L,D-transpeptidase family protein [Oceanococcus sp.]